MQISPEQYNKLLQEGYSSQEISEAIKEVEGEELQKSYAQTKTQIDPRMYSQQSAFGGFQQDNLIKWQLELDNILERAEHILRGDELTFQNGHLIWKKQEDDRKKILNDTGVQKVMKVLSMYLNRNTILADYDPDEVDDKVYDFGTELNDLIYTTYEEMFYAPTFQSVFKGLYNVDLEPFLNEFVRINFVKVFKEFFGNHELERKNGKLYVMIPMGDGLVMRQEVSADMKKVITRETIKRFYTSAHPVAIKVQEEMALVRLEKRKEYPMLIREVVDMVHSAYKRALHGGERRSLREARSITQAEQLTPQGVTINTGQVPKERGFLNPMRYILGKYK